MPFRPPFGISSSLKLLCVPIYEGHDLCTGAGDVGAEGSGGGAGGAGGDTLFHSPQDCIIEIVVLRNVGERVFRLSFDQFEAGLYGDLGAGHLEGELVLALLAQVKLIALAVGDGQLVQLIALVRLHGNGPTIRIYNASGYYIALIGHNASRRQRFAILCCARLRNRDMTEFIHCQVATLIGFYNCHIWRCLWQSANVVLIMRWLRKGGVLLHLQHTAFSLATFIANGDLKPAVQ